MDPLGMDNSVVNRSRRLQQRVAVRPYDVKAVEELVEIAYQAEHHDACILAVDRSLKLDLPVPPRLYIMYGKSYMRKWLKSCRLEGNGIFLSLFIEIIFDIVSCMV